MNIHEKQEVRELFNYPLLEAISRRRTRRLPLGYTIESGMIKKDPQVKSEPLNALETAILCWSGAGITGTSMGEGALSSRESKPITSWVGRATGNPCNIQTTRLFFTNDEGVFLYDPQNPTKPVEFESESDREKILNTFKTDTTKVLDKRLQLFNPPGAIDVEALNNQAGTTLFIPIVDNVELYIWRVFFSIQPFMSYKFFDDIKNRPAGLQKWIDSGYLKGPPVGINSFEQNQRTIYIAPAYLMMQNMQLVAEAMGLGSMIFAGYTGELMLGVTPMCKGLGFRTISDKQGNVNPVGLDGVFESYCPPYFGNMNEAVDAFMEKVGGLASPIGPNFQGPIPFKPDDWQKNRAPYASPSKEQVQMVKDYCNYVYDTYGRIPATFSSKTIPVWLQVHHSNVDYYDRHFAKGMITDAHYNHMKTWHGTK